MKIALFGGSFNPIHKGHLKIANELLDKKVVDEVWFIPCGNHAFGKELASGKDRWNMLNLATRGNPKLKVIDLEIKSRRKSFSANTIRLLRRKFNYNFYFVIGADNLRDLEKWHDFEYLKENVEFILIKRAGFELTNNPGIRIIHTLEMENPISSTKIRVLLSNCDSIKNLVSKNVEEYIKQEELYHAKSLSKSC